MSYWYPPIVFDVRIAVVLLVVSALAIIALKYVEKKELHSNKK